MIFIVTKRVHILCKMVTLCLCTPWSLREEVPVRKSWDLTTTSRQVANSKGSQGEHRSLLLKKLSLGRRVKLYQVAQNGGRGRGAFISRTSSAEADFIQTSNFSQEPSQGGLLTNSLGGQTNRKLCSGLKEPTVCGGERGWACHPVTTGSHTTTGPQGGP